MRSLNYRRIFVLVGVFSLLIYYGIYWMDLLADPDQRTGSDFMGVYVFGQIAQGKGMQYLYEIAEHQRIEEQVVGLPVTPIFYTHMPFTAPLAALIVEDDYIASFKRWALVLLLINALNVCILAWQLDFKSFTRGNLLILFLGAFFFDPTASGFMNGQDTAFVLSGAALWLAGINSEKYFLAGLGLSLTTVRPQVALFLAVPFFFNASYRKVFWGGALGSSVLAGLSIWMLKWEGMLEFIESLRYIEATIWVEPHSLDMPTISGMIRRNFMVINPVLAKVFVWFCYLTGVLAFSYWWHRSKVITEKHLGLITLFSIFLLPYAHYHELTLLLIPIFCLLRILQKNQIDQYYLAVFPLSISWLSALGFAGSGALKFPIVYMIMFVLGYTLTKPEQIISLFQRTPTQLPHP